MGLRLDAEKSRIYAISGKGAVVLLKHYAAMNQVWVSIVAIVISKGVHKVVQHLMFTCEQVTRSVTEFQGSPASDFSCE
jgi:hypothetical protein